MGESAINTPNPATRYNTTLDDLINVSLHMKEMPYELEDALVELGKLRRDMGEPTYSALRSQLIQRLTVARMFYLA